MKIVLLAFCFLTTSVFLQAQGNCDDPQAQNYNKEEGCLYKKTKIKFSNKVILSPEVEETSGVIHFRGGLWTHNDSGGEPVIYKIDPKTGEIIQSVRISNATNFDWEDIAQDLDFIYIGEVGNNYGNREDLTILKINKSAITTEKEITVKAEKIQFVYPEQQNLDKTPYNTNYDCEAFIVHDNKIHLFTKNWVDYQSYHYTIPNKPGIHKAQFRDSLNVNGLITAADLSESGIVGLTGYTKKGKVFMWMLWNYEGDDFFNGNHRRLEVGLSPIKGQVEALCFDTTNSGYITAERIKLSKQKTYQFSLEKYLSPK